MFDGVGEIEVAAGADADAAAIVGAVADGAAGFVGLDEGGTGGAVGLVGVDGGEADGFEEGAEGGGAFEVGEGGDLLIEVDFSRGGEGFADGVGFDGGEPEVIEEEVIGGAEFAAPGVIDAAGEVGGGGAEEEGLPGFIGEDTGGEGAEHYGGGELAIGGEEGDLLGDGVLGAPIPADVRGGAFGVAAILGMEMAARAFVGFIAVGAIGDEGGAGVPVAGLAEGIEDAIEARGEIGAGDGGVAFHGFDEIAEGGAAPDAAEALAEAVGAIIGEFAFEVIAIGSGGEEGVVDDFASGDEAEIALEADGELGGVASGDEGADDIAAADRGDGDFGFGEFEGEGLDDGFVGGVGGGVLGWGGDFGLDRAFDGEEGGAWGVFDGDDIGGAFGVWRGADIGWIALGVGGFGEAFGADGAADFGFFAIDLADATEVVEGGRGGGAEGHLGAGLIDGLDFEVFEGDTEVIGEGGETGEGAEVFGDEGEFERGALGIGGGIFVGDLEGEFGDGGDASEASGGAEIDGDDLAAFGAVEAVLIGEGVGDFWGFGVAEVDEIGGADVVEDFGEDLVTIGAIFFGESGGGGARGIPAERGEIGEALEVFEEDEIIGDFGEVVGGAFGILAGKIVGFAAGFGASDRGAEGDRAIERGAFGVEDLDGPDGDAGEIGEGLFGGFAIGGDEELGDFEHFAGGIAIGDGRGEELGGAETIGEARGEEKFVDGGVEAIVVWGDEERVVIGGASAWGARAFGAGV